jgi:hypothetical protein
MPSVAAESSVRSSGVIGRTRHLATTASPSQENHRNQSPAPRPPPSNLGIVRSVTSRSPGHTRSDGVQFDHSRPASSPPELAGPPPDALAPSDLHGTIGQTAAPAGQHTTSPTVPSTTLFSRILKWSMETKVSVFQAVCAVISLQFTILFGVYAFKQGNTSIQATDRSLAISMWQACVQFPNSPVFLFIPSNISLLLRLSAKT